MSRTELKAISKEQIKGNILTVLCYFIVIAVCSSVVQLIFNMANNEKVALIGTLVVDLMTFCFSFGVIIAFMGITNGRKAMLADLAVGFQRWKDAISVMLLMAVYIFLWSLLFVIPGIIKTYSYYAAPYIMADNPGMGANEAITKSKELMNGHKLDLFVLQLSFILWYFLCGVTFGIAAIYVIPYVETTTANFLKDIGAYGGTGSVVENAPAASEPMEETTPQDDEPIQ